MIAVADSHYIGGFEGALMIDPQMLLDDLKSQFDGAYVKEFAGLKVDRMAILGDPAHAIADFVAANKVDLVMMLHPWLWSLPPVAIGLSDGQSLA